MEDENFVTKQKQSTTTENKIQNPSKFYTNFLQKALIVTIFFVLIPLFPSQAPEFINQSLFNRSWELLHLLFVGIAVSYGLFSRRNEEKEKENHSNVPAFDNAQSYVSRLLQVSSVFDDDAENVSGSEENKVRTWSNQYYRNETPVVVAAEQRNSGSGFAERRLLLPIRSLKSRVLDADEGKVESLDSRSVSRSNSNFGEIRVSNKPKIGELGKDLGDKVEESVVLPSPIPWRSRSGKLEVKEEIFAPSEHTPPPSMEESEINRVESRRLRSRSFRRNSNSSSPKLSPSPSMNSPRKLSPSPSKSAEFQSKKTEDPVKKKSFYLSPPPPPPPPPPPMTFKSSSLKPNSRLSNGGNFSEKELNGNRVNFGSGENSSAGKSIRYEQSIKRPTYMEFPKEEKIKMETETDEDSDSETEDEYETGRGVSPSSKNEEDAAAAAAASSNVMDGVSDVDKKADEFIAKIREQIRLQRIDSIKRSSVQMKRNISSR